MGRLILSIFVGIVVITLLSTGTDTIFHVTGVFPPPGEPFFDTNLLLLATAYRFIFQIAGCYLASMIAKDKAMASAWTLGTLGAIMWLLGTFIFMPGMGPIWYGIVGAVLSIPSALIGEKLYRKRIVQT
jgi:hypothetical protein